MFFGNAFNLVFVPLDLGCLLRGQCYHIQSIIPHTTASEPNDYSVLPPLHDQDELQGESDSSCTELWVSWWARTYLASAYPVSMLSFSNSSILVLSLGSRNARTKCPARKSRSDTI